MSVASDVQPNKVAEGGWHWAAWLCEFAGTAVLLAGGLSAVFLNFGPSSPVTPHLPSASARLLLTGLLFACSRISITPPCILTAQTSEPGGPCQSRPTCNRTRSLREAGTGLRGCASSPARQSCWPEDCPPCS